MKKILLIVLILFILFFSAVYIFIPGELRVSNVSSAACIPRNISDCLKNPAMMNRWWPEQSSKKTDSSFIYKHYAYKLTEPYTDGAAIQISKGDREFKTKIIAISLGRDSCAVKWESSFMSSLNPFKRVGEYFEAVNIKNNMQNVLNTMLTFAGKTQNIYGFPIERTTFTDTILFATRFFTGTYPSVETIYRHINELKNRIKAAGAIEKDFPMLNVNQKDSTGYETMIAICVNKQIQNDKNFFFSRMVPMKDRFLKTTATGGNLTIQQAHEAIQNYMRDRFLSQPAIPFEILVTDRNTETDTAKWKTIIFYPSM
jgi:hypothetical protein